EHEMASKAAGTKAAASKTAATKVAGILAGDVGGTGLKAAGVNDAGGGISGAGRGDTPPPPPPPPLRGAYTGMAPKLPAFDRISIGFPGVVRNGTVLTAPNLGTEAWAGFALADAMSKRLGGHPARLINDAEMQGFGIISGNGLELVLTLGT